MISSTSCSSVSGLPVLFNSYGSFKEKPRLPVGSLKLLRPILKTLNPIRKEYINEKIFCEKDITLLQPHAICNLAHFTLLEYEMERALYFKLCYHVKSYLASFKPEQVVSLKNLSKLSSESVDWVILIFREIQGKLNEEESPGEILNDLVKMCIPFSEEALQFVRKKVVSFLSLVKCMQDVIVLFHVNMKLYKVWEVKNQKLSSQCIDCLFNFFPLLDRISQLEQIVLVFCQLSEARLGKLLTLIQKFYKKQHFECFHIFINPLILKGNLFEQFLEEVHQEFNRGLSTVIEKYQCYLLGLYMGRESHFFDIFEKLPKTSPIRFIQNLDDVVKKFRFDLKTTDYMGNTLIFKLCQISVFSLDECFFLFRELCNRGVPLKDKNILGLNPIEMFVSFPQYENPNWFNWLIVLAEYLTLDNEVTKPVQCTSKSLFPKMETVVKGALYALSRARCLESKALLSHLVAGCGNDRSLALTTVLKEIVYNIEFKTMLIEKISFATFQELVQYPFDRILFK